MKINLTWWRKRPSVHVADYDEQNFGVIDMNAILTEQAIAMLAPDVSQFTTMLQRLSNPGYEEITVSNINGIGVGTTLMDSSDGVIRKVESIRRKTNDDWFAADAWILGVRKPWVEKSDAWRMKHYWLEDEWFPRLTGGKGTFVTGITG